MGRVSQTAYLGLWHALVYALQASLGVACLRARGHRSWRSVMVGDKPSDVEAGRAAGCGRSIRFAADDWPAIVTALR